MKELAVKKPKVTPSPEVRKVDERPAQPAYTSKGKKPEGGNEQWIQAIQDASGLTAEQLKSAVRRASEKP